MLEGAVAGMTTRLPVHASHSSEDSTRDVTLSCVRPKELCDECQPSAENHRLGV
jgi:hypothetical protein